MAGYLNSQGVGGSTLTTILLNALDLGGSPNPTLIDTVPGVTEVVDSLEGLPVEPPSIYIDLEGVNLSRLGTISILQVYIHTTKQVYLIDVLTLREKCFSTCGESGRTLKDIFESSAIPKVFFDVRNDSDALYHHFQINLAGVLDLQLMELATRKSNRRFVSGLSKCIEKDAPLSTTERRSLMQIKNKGAQLFKPENGGSYAVFNERPLREDISLYCAQDVQILPRLWAHYSSKITPKWKLKVISVSKDRVEQSQSPSYNGKGRHMALSPAGW